jgi:abortive infection bacteriophage resistance protein
MRRQIRVNGKQHTATLHYMSNYGYIPLWILVKVLSFGIVSELYTILKEEDQESISSFYGIDPSTLAIYLSVLSNYRNLCAHEDILYDHRTQRSIPDTKYHIEMGIEKNEDDEYKFGKNDLFSILIVLKVMLNDKDFHNFINEVSYEIDYLTGRVKTVSIESILDKVGFPDNWRDIRNIN